MTCHRRCTFVFVTVLTLVVIALLLIELFTPYMYIRKNGATGLIYECSAASTPSTLPNEIKKNICQFTFKPNAETISALISLAFMVIFIIYSIVVWFKLCCSTDGWPLYFIILVRFGIALNILALIANIITTAVVATKIPEENTFSYAFYAVCVADGLILAIIIMLISMLCCPTREKDESGNSHRGSTQPSTYPQPVFYGQFQPVGTMPPGGVYYNGQGAPQPVYDVIGNDFNNTFPSNSRFANWNSDSREPLYRYLYTFAWSTVFGSKK